MATAVEERARPPPRMMAPGPCTADSADTVAAISAVVRTTCTREALRLHCPRAWTHPVRVPRCRITAIITAALRVSVLALATADAYCNVDAAVWKAGAGQGPDTGWVGGKLPFSAELMPALDLLVHILDQKTWDDHLQLGL